MKPVIAIYGGAFSPPTVAHVEVAKRIADLPSISDVWVVPAYRHRFKDGAATYHDRVDLCKHAFDGFNIKISVRQIDYAVVNRGGDGSTRSVMEYLQSEYTDYEFRMVIGQDNAESIDTWKDPEWLMTNVNFIILPRGGCDPVTGWYTNPPHLLLNDFPAMTMASSSVRLAIHNGEWEKVQASVPPKVFDAIKRTGASSLTKLPLKLEASS